ncbi:hypothetical protein [Methylomonas sp. ZR1]|uniref:hypothetical protein n=1 Tax=Methylomonas sp. ZR1 TaxID=1797072 RepID=UPI001491F7A2|nr:hypothetical protein [Methylomonas sp. ZR1]
MVEFYARRWWIEPLFHNLKRSWGISNLWQQSRTALETWMQIRSTASEVDFRQFLNINPLSSVDWLVFKNLILFLMRPFTKNPQFRAMLTSTCDLVRTLKPVQLLMKCNYRTDNNQ